VKVCLSCEGVTNTAAQRCGHCGAWLLSTDAVHYPVRRGERDAGNALLGTVVDGKYRLQAVLGRGGLGTVYQAMHIGTLVTVALKLLHPRFAERPEYRTALLPEARRAATVTHAGCARLLDVGEAENGVAYLAMELVEGDTLDALMRGGPLAPGHAVQILLQIADALAAIHAAGLVHCDLAPRNVMVATRGGELRVKVLDFGIARTVTMAGPVKAGAGEFSGFVNPVFSAPELLDGETVDPRADVYSFGSLAWLLLTGTPPVDDADARRAALAVAAGELRPWPKVAGVPRRLARLVQRCVQRDRRLRPATAAAIRGELQVIAGSRRPARVRAAALACTVGVMAVLAAPSEGVPPFLRSRVGSAFVLADPNSTNATTVQHLQSSALDTMSLLFGGFRADRLCVDVSRGGVPLLHAPLHPEVDQVAGTLTLSTAQPQWRDVLEGLARSTREQPVELSFVVPGRAPLGVARVRVDDEAPEITFHVDPAERALTGSSRLVWQCRESIGLDTIGVEVELAAGRALNVPLPGGEGTFDLGAALAGLVDGVERLGPGKLRVVARDLATNVARTAAVEFDEIDLLAPAVVEVTGPAGEPFVPVGATGVAMRVRLSHAEAGCTLRLFAVDQVELWRMAVPADVASFAFDLPATLPRGQVQSGSMWFHVEDAVGNRTQREFAITLRDRMVRIDPVGGGPGAKWLGRDLVVGGAAAVATVAIDPEHRVVRAEVDLSATAATPETLVPLPIVTESSGRVRLDVPALPAGSHVLRFWVEERAAVVAGQATSFDLTLRALPPVLEVRVPRARSRFLPGLVEAGVLARRGAGFGEGAGWRIDPAWLPYIRGTLWIGAATLVPLPLPERTPVAPLLPEVTPVPGRNVVAIELRDVLDRPVRVFVGDGAAPERRIGDTKLDVIADFWWNDQPPVPVGEELLVEYGHSVPLRVRLPLPFVEAERTDVRLAIAQSELGAVQLAPEGDGCIAQFDLSFQVWSGAANLTDLPREDYADQAPRGVHAAVITPAGRHAIDLRIRPTRSTLEPFTLDRFGAVPRELAALRMVPVLAPASSFEEPVPATAPPRALFRPQLATVVRDMTDFLLAEREITCGEARALMPFLEKARTTEPMRFVHRDDPLGVQRLRGDALLPPEVAAAPADAALTGVDFYQAWTLSRVLGLAVGDDPTLFRLPLGCELELAAYAFARLPACSGAAANGSVLSMSAFVAAARDWANGRVPTAATSREAGDVVAATQRANFVGLDFGVREWVADLPHVPTGVLLLREWIGDHATHLARVEAFALGTDEPPPDLAGPLRTLGVVRGLALGELDGLIDARGAPVGTSREQVPDTVPGVLRTEQVRRDGRDLLSMQRDPRLARIGFRVAGTASTVARLRGRR